MTTPTPQDMERARALVHGWLHDRNPKEIAARIAQAIADERERCAKVAEDHRRYRPFDTDMAARGARMSVAAAIRSGGDHA